MNATKFAVMAMLLGACSGDRPPKEGTANLNGRYDTPLQSASNEVQGKAGVAAPAVVGNAIQFWIFSGSPGRNLYRCSLDLATGVLTVEAK